MKKSPTQPSEEAERELLEIIDSTSETVIVRGKRYKIKPIKKGTRIKISQILLDSKGVHSEEPVEEQNQSQSDMAIEDKVVTKCAAAYILNSWWTLKFMGGIIWSIYWRWLYYVRQYTDSDYFMLLSVCKKKVEKQTRSYTMNIILLTATKVTTMAMTRAEVKRSLLENRLAQHGEQQKSSQV